MTEEQYNKLSYMYARKINECAYLREENERLKTAIDSFNRSEYNLRESIGQLQEQVKERYKLGYRDGYSQGKSDGIDETRDERKDAYY